MKYSLFTLILLIAGSGFLAGQSYFATDAYISFFSEAPLEDILAENNKVTTTFDIATGELNYAVPIKDFEFRKSLMKTHFNENYMESEKFPKASFKGVIRDWDPTLLDDENVHSVIVEGDMTIHGTMNPVTYTATLIKKGQEFVAESTFPISVAEYGVKVPTLLIKKIAEEVQVTIKVEYNLYTP